MTLVPAANPVANPSTRMPGLPLTLARPPAIVMDCLYAAVTRTTMLTFPKLALTRATGPVSLTVIVT